MHDDENTREHAASETQAMSILDLRWKLPLFDNLFLMMQGQNIMLVDLHLRDLETDLLMAYIERERTPLGTTFVSALSQMWIFAVYELLRTWRQFVRDLQKDVRRPEFVQASDDDGVPANLAAVMWRQHATEYRDNEAFRDAISEASAGVEPIFRRIEALRMNLAKHEVPKRKGELAIAPGYGRIDLSNGSIYWMVDLGGGDVDLVSRRGLSDELRRAVIGRSLDDEDSDTYDDEIDE